MSYKPEKFQEEFLEIKADSTTKDNFYPLTLKKFWNCLVNSKIDSLTLRVLFHFSSIYLCETGSSALILIKTEQQNRLAVDSDLTIALENT